MTVSHLESSMTSPWVFEDFVDFAFFYSELRSIFPSVRAKSGGGLDYFPAWEIGAWSHGGVQVAFEGH